MLVVVLFSALSFSSCGGDDDDDPSVIDKSISISPTDLSMLASANSTVSFTITTNQYWTINGTPDWLNISAKSGEGNATIIATALEPNSSDQERTATLTVTGGDTPKIVTITQTALYAKNTRVYIDNQLILKDGFYADLTFDRNVLGYVEGFYYASVLNTKTLDEIYEEVKDGTNYSATDYNYTIMTLPDANTEYIYCVIGYTGNGTVKQYGPMEIYRFKSKSSSNYCDAAIGSVTYNSTRWSFTISKQQRCHHYWRMQATNATADNVYSNYPYVLMAKIIRDRINDPNYPEYDYYLNDGTITVPRDASETSFYVWTWGVDDNGEFSGNIRDSYKNTTSSASYVMRNSSNKISTWHGATRQEIEKTFSNVKVDYVR